ncbi:MAG: YfbM family protein [Pirellulales bacterium]|nr:YfbM family protein [Pirellulales bacterium]
MSCLGVHFAITAAEAESLVSLPTDEERLEYVQEQLEERYFSESRELVAESDKAWDAMHRALADGELTWDGGTYPLNHAVLAGTLLYSGSDYIITLKSPGQVKDIAAALQGLTEPIFRQRYESIDGQSYDGELGDEDFEYTWHWLQEVRALYVRAAAEDRHVLFTADQ